ncbi:hypothetical protein LUZ60_003319 [Juncus effusus]|nr:hypothetical protein LUZ60_003319 [Juncus effusus]
MGTCFSSHSKPPAAAAAMNGDPAQTGARPSHWSNRWLDMKEKQFGKKTDKVTKTKGNGAVTKSPSPNGAGCNWQVSVDELAGVPGRMFLNGTSEVASIYTQQGKKGTNQDAMLVWENFGCESDTTFCGVFDGHGPYGHLVAKKVRDSLPLKLCNEWKALLSGEETNQNQNENENGNISNTVSSDSEEASTLEEDLIDKEEKIPEVFVPLKQSFLKAFKSMDRDLKFHENIDCFCSGTTAVTVVKKGNDLIIGNLGDSRAIIGTKDEHNNLIAEQLTTDLKPNLPNEMDRIRKCKGRVFALQDEPDVARVWLPNSDSPGLAMARAFGDFCLKNYGLISVPMVSYRQLTPKDQFVILATDGVWDVLSNKEAVEIVGNAPNQALAARALVDTAVRAWKLKFPTSKSDDCAVLCLFLDTKSQPVPIPDPVKQDPIDLVHENNKPEPVDPVHANNKTEESVDQVHEKNEMEPVDPVHENNKTEFPVHGNDETVDPVREENKEEDKDVKVSVKSSLERMDTVREPEEIVPVSEEINCVESVPVQSARRLVDCIANTEEEEWSALEGFTRANSIINMPRFLTKEKKSGSWRKKQL